MRRPGSHTSPVYTGVGPGENHRGAVSFKRLLAGFLPPMLIRQFQ